jgi:hypothetical protein
MPCHLARQLRQQVPVACWATKTGCPRNGVCFPSLAGCAGASRRATRSRAWARIVSLPLAPMYSLSRAVNRKRRRKADVANRPKISSRSFNSAAFTRCGSRLCPLRCSLRRYGARQCGPLSSRLAERQPLGDGGATRSPARRHARRGARWRPRKAGRRTAHQPASHPRRSRRIPSWLAGQ